MNFKEICDDIAEILEKKNMRYGDSFRQTYYEYGGISICLRLEDKLNRLKNIVKDFDSSVHSATDTLLDIAGYAILALSVIGEADGRSE